MVRLRLASIALAQLSCLLLAIISSILLAAPAAAQITQHPSDVTVFAGQSATFTVTAPGGTDPRWQADEGGGFNTLLDDATYSGSRTNTLRINSATPAMDGYKFRVWIRVGPDYSSNAATLTVQIPVPVVTSVAVPPNATYGVGQDLDFIVSFDHSVFVTGTPQLGLTVGSTARLADYVSGSGTNALRFRYRLVAGEQDANGITVGSMTLNGGTLKDNATNSADAVLTLNSVASTTNVLVDGVAPVVNSAGPVSGATAADTSVDFEVTFSEAVYGASTSSFSLTSTGSAGGTISSVSAVSSGSFRVTVNAIHGTGTLKLNVPASAALTDPGGNGLASAFTAGTVHTVAVSTVPGQPTITSVTAGDRQAVVHFMAPINDGGDPVTSYTVTSSPDALTETLTSSPIAITGLSNGTAYTFTVTANNGVGPGTPSTPSSSVIPTDAQLALSPSGGALPPAMAGEDYSHVIAATGGVGTQIYSLSSGTLPDGLVLNLSTGALTGPLSAQAEVKDYAFSIRVRDGNGTTADASYTLSVVEQKVTVSNIAVTVPGGSTPTNVNLTKGATGGPFTDAEIVEVAPSNAGKASVVNGEFAQVGGGTTGWYLKFIPNPAFHGQVSVRFRLTSALGVSNTGIVTYVLGYDPAEIAVQMDTMVRGFVQTRQNLIASNLSVPGLVERRQLKHARDPVSARLSPSIDGINAYFATSLAQTLAAAQQAEGIVDVEVLPFNIWLEGTFMLHSRPQNNNRWGNFGMLSAGADYLLSEKVLLGLSFHYDRMSDPTDADAILSGNGWLAGPYASVELGDGVFWDTSALYGGSSNAIDTAFWDGSFDTQRWLFDTAVKGQWQLDATTTVNPRLRTVYLSETVQDYAVENVSGDSLDLGGFTTEQLRVSLGADLARRMVLENGATLTPSVGLTGGFSGLDGSGLFGQASAGLSLGNLENWAVDFGLLFNIEVSGQTSTGIKVGLGGQLWH